MCAVSSFGEAKGEADGEMRASIRVSPFTLFVLLFSGAPNKRILPYRDAFSFSID